MPLFLPKPCDDHPPLWESAETLPMAHTGLICILPHQPLLSFKIEVLAIPKILSAFQIQGLRKAWCATSLHPFHPGLQPAVLSSYITCSMSLF